MSQFDKLIDRVLSHEGGYSNDPQDPGGETQWGISKRAHPDVNIKALTRAQAIDIYRADYWDKIKGDQLPAGIAFQPGRCRQPRRAGCIAVAAGQRRGGR